MRYRNIKRSGGHSGVRFRMVVRVGALPVIAVVAVAGALTTRTTHDTPYRWADHRGSGAVAPLMAEQSLASAPNVRLAPQEAPAADLSPRPVARGTAAPAADHTAPARPAAPANPSSPVPVVKELTRDKSFSLVAFTGTDLAGAGRGWAARVRAARSDGQWSPWYSADPVETNGHDRAPGALTGTEPVYVSPTTKVQVAIARQLVPISPDDAGQHTEAATDDELLQRLKAVLIDPGHGLTDENLATTAVAGGPRIIGRAQWGADESLRCADPVYDDGVSAIVVHHTAGRNDYTRAESAGIVRAIYAYHASKLGWCDIGYSALVDKYGQIFEGRFGGLDKPVEGAHAGGFNENTASVAMMGDFETKPPTQTALQATGRYIGWRARVAGLDPKGNTTLVSEGTEYSKYDEGEAVNLPVVFAHRDVGNTTCPGDAAYAAMGMLREIASGNTTAAMPQTVTPPPADTPLDLDALADLTQQLLGLFDSKILEPYLEAGRRSGQGRQR